MRLKYNFIGLILACGLGLSSCNDSFLDRNPKDQLSDASFWKNAEDAQKFATGIYLYLIEPENHTIMTDCYTDNAIPVHVTAEQGQLSAGTATSISRKTKCSTFAKHFVPKSHLLTQFKM